MPASDLFTLVYASSAAPGFGSPRDLEALMAFSRPRNHDRGLSGILLHHQGRFMQVLEGTQTAVEDLFARITRDRRHTAVTRMLARPVTGRLFGDWSMAYRALSDDDLRSNGIRDLEQLRQQAEGLAGSPDQVLRLISLFCRQIR